MTPPLFTVFTPTYNRAYVLDRVYRSLCAQTFRDFEWLIVDDGSSDNTKELVEGWTREAPFPIRYLRQENKGKHFASNVGIREARGDLFLNADSDDEFPPDALETFKEVWFSIPEDDRPRFAGAAGLCVDQDGKPVGEAFPRSPLDSNHLEKKYVYKTRGEKWGFTRTDVMREFPFVESDQFVGFRWGEMGRKYKTRFFNKVVRVYYTNMTDAITYRAKKVRKPLMNALRQAGTLNEELDYFRYAPMRFLKTAALFVRFSLHADLDAAEQRARLSGFPQRFLRLIAYPVGCALWLRDKIVER